MCFSAAVDLVTGLAVGAIGLDAVRHVRRSADLPLAVLPVVLGAHQLVEAVVWWGLQGNVSREVWRPALGLYLVIAFGLLPVLVPVAVGALEPQARRRRVAVFTVLGTVVSVALTYAVVRGPVHAGIEGHHIAYSVDLWQGGLLVAVYVMATCDSMLISSHEHVRWFGSVNLIAVGLLLWLNQSAFISLWCIWAAVTSIAIALHLRQTSQSTALRPHSTG